MSTEPSHQDPVKASFGSFEAQMLLESVVNAKNSVALASSIMMKHDAMQASVITLVAEIESLKRQASAMVNYMEKYLPEDPAAIEMAKKLSRARLAHKGNKIASGLRRAVMATKKASIEASKSCSAETLRELAESIAQLELLMM
jgi:hypothetical protein